MALNANLTLTISANESIVLPASGTTIEQLARKLEAGLTPITLSDGTGANQVSKGFAIRETLTASTRSLDLTGLVTTSGPYQWSVSLAKVKLLYVANDSATDGDVLLVGGAGSNPWYSPWSASTTKEKVLAGSAMLKTNLLAQATNPWTVDASNKVLLIDSGAATISYRLIVLGV